MSQTNFLIGRGELLTHDIVGPKRMPGKAEVYTFAQARELLVPQFRRAAQTLDELPADACPGDFAVARLMMNPSFIARSYFPTGLLRSTGLESIGSRTVKVKPQAWTRKGPPQETTTTELFVAGKRKTVQGRTTQIGVFDFRLEWRFVTRGVQPMERTVKQRLPGLRRVA